MINFALKQIREKTYHFFKEKNNKAMKMLQMLSSIKFMLIHVCQCFVVL